MIPSILIITVLGLAATCGFYVAKHRLLKAERVNKAYHESGHAIISILLGHGFDTIQVTPENKSSPGVVTPHKHAFSGETLQEQEDIIKIALAGVIASNIRCIGDHADQGYSDNLVIRKVLADFPEVTGGTTPYDYLRIMKSEVSNLLKENLSSLDTLASHLAKKDFMTEKEVMEILPELRTFLMTA